MHKPEYACGIWAFGNLGDRFLLSGYQKDRGIEEQIRVAGNVPELCGVELNAPTHVNAATISTVKRALANAGLRCVAVGAEVTADPVWKYGSLTSKDPAIRRRAIEEHKEAMDLAVELGSTKVNVWMGQDGHDYPFQISYADSLDWLLEGVTELAEYRSDVRLCLEYKPKEPRVRSLLATVGDASSLVREVGRPNVGMTIDVGHALYAGETVAESIVKAARQGKLFHVHLNDNYGSWDDDLVVGSVHTIEFLELLYWLDQVGYRGEFSMDIFPYREDAASAVSESIQFLESLWAVLERVGTSRIQELILQSDPIRTLREIREMLYS